jgi:hypothetical protein
MATRTLAVLSILAVTAFANPIHTASAAAFSRHRDCATSALDLERGRCTSDYRKGFSEWSPPANVDQTPERTGPKVDE